MMKRKVKLAFEQLERELSIIPQTELAQVLGGFSSGDSSGSSGTLNADASLDEIVDYFENLGFVFEEDSSGNYYFNAAGSSGSIMLEEVNVYAYASGSGHSSGEDDWWLEQSGIMADYGDFLGSYISYFESYGHVFTCVNGVPSYDYSASNNSNNNNQEDDPVQEVLKKIDFEDDISQQFKERFEASLASIKDTAAGKKLLDLLIDKVGDITVTNNHDHSVQGYTLHAGIFDTNSGDLVAGYHEQALAHELFHLAQMAEYGVTKTEVSYEVEALLFEYEIAKEAGESQKNAFLDNHFRNHDDYREEFLDYVNSMNKSITGFNSLIDGFKTGTNGGGAYDSYDETHIDSFGDVIVDNILN